MAGSYTVTLTASNGLGEQSDTLVVVVHSPVQGLALAATTPIELGTMAHLTATLSDGTSVAYSWDLGDGTTESGAQVSHLYAAIGSYVVNALAQNPVSSQSAAITVQVVDVAISGLTVNTDSPIEIGSTTHFNVALATGTNVTYVWDFGDGTAGAGVNPSHVYGAGGTYVAKVTATNSRGSSQQETVVTVVDAPIAGLAASSNSPSELGTPSHFTASITKGTQVSYAWDFGNGTTGTGATPTHTYTAVGDYTATVTATNARGSVSQSTLVTILDIPVSGLAASNSGPTVVGSATTFQAMIGAGTNVAYSWDFGDGTTGTGATPTHSYAAAGVYTAKVTASNARGEQSTTTLVTIQAAEETDVLSGLSATNDGPTVVGNSTRFTATVTAGTNVVYTWDFGDGATGVGANPTHTYAITGGYTATVTASNSTGSQSATTLVLVSDAPPTGVTFTGIIYDDKNGNSAQDAGEPGIPGVELTLADTVQGAALPVADATVPAASVLEVTPAAIDYEQVAVTDATGVYTFTNVPYGVYQVTAVLPEGYEAAGPLTFSVTLQPVAPNQPSPVVNVPLQVKDRLFIPMLQRSDPVSAQATPTPEVAGSEDSESVGQSPPTGEPAAGESLTDTLEDSQLYLPIMLTE